MFQPALNGGNQRFCLSVDLILRLEELSLRWHHRRGSCRLYVGLRRREERTHVLGLTRNVYSYGPRRPLDHVAESAHRRPRPPRHRVIGGRIFLPGRGITGRKLSPTPCRCTARPCGASDCVGRSHFESVHGRGPVHEHVHRCGVGAQLPSGDEETAVAGYVVVGGVISEQRCGK